MNKKITIMILGSTTSRPRQVSFSKTFLMCITLMFVGFFLILGSFVNEYLLLESYMVDSDNLNRIKENQEKVIALQKESIREFGQEVLLLKKKLMALNDFEKRVRTIANLTNPDVQGNLWGVGGSTPDDLKPRK